MEPIVWSKFTYTMREFIDAHSEDLPVICKVTSGYLGYEEDIHQIGTGDLYWVFGVQRQKRLVVKPQSATYYLSIPVEYPIKVHMLMDNSKKPGALVTIRDVVDAMTTKSHPIPIMFENNCMVSFQVGADYENAAKLGMLTTEQTYEEKYLLAYTISNCAIYSKTHSIPVYLPIELVVAQSLDGGRVEDFSRWKNKVIAITNTLKSPPTSTCQEIILFETKPSGGDYEYIRLRNFAKLADKGTHGAPKLKYENLYGLHSPAIPTKPPQSAKKQSNISVPLPRFPVTPPSNSNPSFPETSRTESKTGNRSRRPLPSLPTSVSGADSEKSYEELDISSVPSSSKFGIYQSLSEVPVQLDVEHLTVEEVIDCLRLMKLDQHLDAFRSKQIDGRMLLSMTKEMLVEDFQFKQFDAMQLTMFAKSGWRPK